MNGTVITFGEILMRLSVPNHGRFVQATSFDICYGGSEANVAASLAHFGVKSRHVTRLPSNDFGLAAAAMLRHHGVDDSSVVYGDERMAVYFLENGAMQRASRIIYDRFDSAFAAISPGMIDWERALADAAWFHWTGITPAISEGAAACLLEGLIVANKKGIKVSADINYRRNLWRYGKTAKEVMPELISLSHHLVGAETDFENTLSVQAESFEEGCLKVSKLNPKIETISMTTRDSVSSSHNRLSGTLWTKDKVYTTKEYDLIPIVDRIGGGDAFMAGLIYGSLNGFDYPDTIDYAVAASALKHSIPGDINLSTVDEVENLRESRHVGVLLR